MIRYAKHLPVIIAALSVIGPAPVAAQNQDAVDHASQYGACMKLAEHSPAAAYDSASTWVDLGGASPARHCQAVALIGLGQFEEAARRLETLAMEMREGAGLRAGVLAHAAQAWNMIGKLERAHAVLTSAIQLQPDNVDLWIDRAVTLGAAQNFWESVDDLNQAIELQPDLSIAYAYRAVAYRYLEAADLAEQDVESAIALNPTLPEAYLERGVQRRLKGEIQGAREDWIKVIELAEGFPVADTARANIEKLELGN